MGAVAGARAAAGAAEAAAEGAQRAAGAARAAAGAAGAAAAEAGSAAEEAAEAAGEAEAAAEAATSAALNTATHAAAAVNSSKSKGDAVSDYEQLAVNVNAATAPVLSALHNTSGSNSIIAANSAANAANDHSNCATCSSAHGKQAPRPRPLWRRVLSVLWRIVRALLKLAIHVGLTVAVAVIVSRLREDPVAMEWAQRAWTVAVAVAVAKGGPVAKWGASLWK